MAIVLEIYECDNIQEFDIINEKFLTSIKEAGFDDVQDDTAYALPDIICRDNGKIAIPIEEPYTQTLKEKLTAEELLKVKIISSDTDPCWFPNPGDIPTL